MGRADRLEQTDPTDALTEDEREVLRVALERGYYEVPREATLTDLAAELGRSDVEVSRRLRRATSDLLCQTALSDEMS
jgi:predicted DNA binding protein